MSYCVTLLGFYLGIDLQTCGFSSICVLSYSPGNPGDNLTCLWNIGYTNCDSPWCCWISAPENCHVNIHCVTVRYLWSGTFVETVFEGPYLTAMQYSWHDRHTIVFNVFNNSYFHSYIQYKRTPQHLDILLGMPWLCNMRHKQTKDIPWVINECLLMYHLHFMLELCG